MKMDIPEKKRIYIFDLMRVIAFFMVFFVHILQKYGMPLGRHFGIENFYWVSLGGLGITIFFFLGGAVLENKYIDKNFKFKEFAINRLFRIYPSYWLSVLFVVLFLGITVVSNKNFTTLLADFSGLLVFTGTNLRNYILPTGWFVGVILILYLLFPLMHYLFKKFNINKVLLLLLFVEVISRILVGEYMSGVRPLDWFPLCRVFEFGLGMYFVRNDSLFRRVKEIKTSFLSRPIEYISNISYQAYLIHYYFLNHLVKTNNMSLFFIRTLVLTLMVANAIYFLDGIVRTILNNFMGYLLSNADNRTKANVNATC